MGADYFAAFSAPLALCEPIAAASGASLKRMS
jgi:hypothetical protein